MRIERAIDSYLAWRRLERDATPRSLDSYWRILVKLADEHPEAPIDSLATEDLRRFLNSRWGDKSAATRANVISVMTASVPSEPQINPAKSKASSLRTSNTS